MKRFLFIAAVVLTVGVAPSLAGDARSSAVPSNTTAPSISGTAHVGQTLTASSGSWSGTTPISFAYAWQRCDSSGSSCAGISGASSQTYTITIDDLNHTLRVAVTATNSSGSSTATSGHTASVTGATPPHNTDLPHITGSATVGSKLTATNGTWSGTTPITYAYAWSRCSSTGASCAPIGGATSQTYTVTTADSAHTLRVVVTATNAAGSAQATSAATTVAAVSAPANATAPTITGTATVGQTLSATNGTWTGSTPISYAYTWYRCNAGETNCAAIAGANGQKYVLTASDAARYVLVVVTAGNGAGSARANSHAVGPIGSATPSPPPTPSGTTKLPNGETSIQASSVSETDRLTISSVKFTPSVITGRAPVTVTFKVIENNKYDVAGALVYVLGLPYNWAKASPEAATGADGTVSISITPTRAAPKRGALVLFVRARTPKGNLLAGSSTRRLVQVSMRP
jgi:hypothetical protein